MIWFVVTDNLTIIVNRLLQHSVRLHFLLLLCFFFFSFHFHSQSLNTHAFRRGAMEGAMEMRTTGICIKIIPTIDTAAVFSN